MAVWTTLMARAVTVGPGGSARTACNSSSSHCRTRLSLIDGGYCSNMNSGGGSVTSSGGSLARDGSAVWPTTEPTLDRATARTTSRTSGNLCFTRSPPCDGLSDVTAAKPICSWQVGTNPRITSP